MAQKKFQVSVEIRQLDGEEVLRDPITITRTVDVDLHRVSDYKIPAAYAAFAWKDTKETAGVQAPSLVLAYSPERPVRMAINPSADRTTAGDFNAYTANAVLAQLALFVNLDGSDLGLDNIDFGCPDATNTAKVTLMASGEDA